MKKNLLAEVKRLSIPKNLFLQRLEDPNYHRKYVGKFSPEEDWILYLADEENEDEDNKFTGVMCKGLFECLEFLEEENILSMEVEMSMDIADYTLENFEKYQREYRQKILNHCVTKGLFDTDIWAIEMAHRYVIAAEEKWYKSLELLVTKHICPYCDEKTVTPLDTHRKKELAYLCANEECVTRQEPFHVTDKFLIKKAKNQNLCKN